MNSENETSYKNRG